ncbi:MAG: hypothetical protein FGM39_09835 [Phycisphaerales bacterium]|nr:hypothetical protein [Phycisphaerales bacterium]
MRHTPAAALIAALALSAATVAQDAPPPPPGGPGTPAGRDGAPPREGGPRGGRGQQGAAGANLEASMKAMNRSVKALKGLLSDPAKKDEALKTVSEAQRACAVCKAAPLPAKFTEKAPDAEAKARIEAEFRGDLRKNLRMLLDLEDAILAGKADEAAAILAKIEELRDHAHEEMGVD